MTPELRYSAGYATNVEDSCLLYVRSCRVPHNSEIVTVKRLRMIIVGIGGAVRDQLFGKSGDWVFALRLYAVVFPCNRELLEDLDCK